MVILLNDVIGIASGDYGGGISIPQIKFTKQSKSLPCTKNEVFH